MLKLERLISSRKGDLKQNVKLETGKSIVVDIMQKQKINLPFVKWLIDILEVEKDILAKIRYNKKLINDVNLYLNIV